jgi:hypothetical protein
LAQTKTWRRIMPWLEEVFGPKTSRRFYYDNRHLPGFPQPRYVNYVPYLCVEEGREWLEDQPRHAPGKEPPTPEPDESETNGPVKRKRGRPRKIYPIAAE